MIQIKEAGEEPAFAEMALQSERAICGAWSAHAQLDITPQRSEANIAPGASRGRSECARLPCSWHGAAGDLHCNVRPHAPDPADPTALQEETRWQLTHRPGCARAVC